MQIYKDYRDEPEDQFQPLTEQLRSEFYNLEMDSFTEDISFYQKHLPKEGAILELGCGSGRVAKEITTRQRQITGIDLSLCSLRQALSQKADNTSFICMDMMQLAFTQKFQAVIIPYNTLNLLSSRENILDCLHSCKNLLLADGHLLAQVYIPSNELFLSKKKSFQFQFFDRPQGGRIIKEILKQFCPQSQTIAIEERFRVRPMTEGQVNEDWHQIFSVAALPVETWLQMFTRSGFKVKNTFRDYTCSQRQKATSTCLLAHLVI